MTGKYPMVPLGNGAYRICVPRSAITGRYKTERRKQMEPMTLDEYQKAIKDMYLEAPTLELYRRAMAFDDNFVWHLQSGDMANLLEVAIERIEELEAKIQAVKDAWNIPGPAPMIHFQAQQTLVDEWPTLGGAVEALADG